MGKLNVVISAVAWFLCIYSAVVLAVSAWVLVRVFQALRSKR